MTGWADQGGPRRLGPVLGWAHSVAVSTLTDTQLQVASCRSGLGVGCRLQDLDSVAIWRERGGRGLGG